jgi:hypothetical protein
MPLLVTSVPNLVQGISQQPDNLRYPGQSDEQINAWSTVVEGLVKRPPTEYVKNVNTTAPGNSLFTHFVKREEANKYVLNMSMVGSTPTLKVTNTETGDDLPVTAATIATNYLSNITNPREDVKALTVADYTFLVNKKRVVRALDDPADYVTYSGDIYKCINPHTSTAANTPDVSDDWIETTEVKSADAWAVDTDYVSDAKTKPLETEALVFVKLGDYEKTYDIYLDGNVVLGNLAHHTLTGHTYLSGELNSSGNHAGGREADTEYIAQQLGTVLDTFLGTTSVIGSATISGGSGFEATQNLPTVPSGRRLPTGAHRQVSYEFFIDQYTDNTLTTKLATGAKGTVVFNTSGAVQSYRLTHGGSGYDGTLAADTLKLVIRKHVSITTVAWSGGGANPRGSSRKLSQSTSTTRTDITSATAGYIMPTFTAALPTEGVYSIEREGAVIKIKSTSDFSIRTEDGLGGQGLGLAYKEVNNITDLPQVCFNDFRIKVVGDAELNQDDYFVKFQTKDREDFGEGSWVECPGWDSDPKASYLSKGIDTSFDVETMPVVLVPYFAADSDNIESFSLQTPNELANVVEHNSVYYNLIEDHKGTANTEPGVGADWEEYWVVTTGFTLARAWELNTTYNQTRAGWTTRQAGDDFTNPFPSFTGTTINDIFFFKNRLGILTDSNIIFSEADEYFNFFRTTTQQLLDSAPIDVGLSHTKVAQLQHALPFQEKLMLFSRQSQFVLRGADLLTPKTVSISPVTEYDISDNIDPVALGNYIYFPFKRDAFEGMYEYFVDNNTEVFEANEITAQVPKLIPSNITHLVGTASENMIVAKSSNDDYTLFVYKYYWQNKEKIQSAWMKFTYSRKIRGFDFIDSDLLLLTEDGQGLHLEKATMENGLVDDGLSYKLYLDSRLDSSSADVWNSITETWETYDEPWGDGFVATYDAASKTTTITGFPYDPVDVQIYTKGGTYVEFTRTSATSGTVSGDLSSTPFFAGIPYNMLYRFSNQILKQPTERGGRSASDYTFQTIRNASIEYADTGHFTVEVTPRFRDTYKYPYNPALLASISTLNDFTPESGHFRFAVQAQPNEATIEIKSDSALPCKLLAAEFESMVIPRAKRYGS